MTGLYSNSVPRILVLGSLNIDLVQRVPRLPAAGETLQGEELQTFVGGKGANQACAAARLGGQVTMAGMLGGDVFAPRILSELKNAGVNTSLVYQSEKPTGSAIIQVLPSGDNSIVIAPGANGAVTPEFARQAAASLTTGDLLLCQLETPLEAVAVAIETAHANGATTVLDPAPARALRPALLRSVDILTPNQTEAAILLGSSSPPDSFEEARDAAASLQQMGANVVIVKLGELGCFVNEPVPGHRVTAVDTTAAGDTFNGALAAALATGKSLLEAAQFANAAAALSVTKPGAIASIPSLDEVRQLCSL